MNNCGERPGANPSGELTPMRRVLRVVVIEVLVILVLPLMMWWFGSLDNLVFRALLVLPCGVATFVIAMQLPRAVEELERVRGPSVYLQGAVGTAILALIVAAFYLAF